MIAYHNFRRTLPLIALLVIGLRQSALADGTKASQTPFFWQRDPEADFDNEGRNHCAPVAIADGLVYLTKARGLDDLVDETDHDGQIDLITDLAAEMDTDPTEGTNPDKILTGLLGFAKKQGYEFERLELASWRGVSEKNKQYKIGAIPSLAWMTAAAKDPDVVEVFNLGWYQKEADGIYSRHSGHWVNVVGAGPGALQFNVHNPILEPDRQKAGTGLSLKLVDPGFAMPGANGKPFKMAGYYQAQGLGLPFDPKVVSAAVLDSVIVFKLKAID